MIKPFIIQYLFCHTYTNPIFKLTFDNKKSQKISKRPYVTDERVQELYYSAWANAIKRQ